MQRVVDGVLVCLVRLCGGALSGRSDTTTLAALLVLRLCTHYSPSALRLRQIPVDEVAQLSGEACLPISVVEGNPEGLKDGDRVVARNGAHGLLQMCIFGEKKL